MVRLEDGSEASLADFAPEKPSGALPSVNTKALMTDYRRVAAGIMSDERAAARIHRKTDTIGRIVSAMMMAYRQGRQGFEEEEIPEVWLGLMRQYPVAAWDSLPGLHRHLLKMLCDAAYLDPDSLDEPLGRVRIALSDRCPLLLRTEPDSDGTGWEAIVANGPNSDGRITERSLCREVPDDLVKNLLAEGLLETRSHGELLVVTMRGFSAYLGQRVAAAFASQQTLELSCSKWPSLERDAYPLALRELGRAPGLR